MISSFNINGKTGQNGCANRELNPGRLLPFLNRWKARMQPQHFWRWFSDTRVPGFCKHEGVHTDDAAVSSLRAKFCCILNQTNVSYTPSLNSILHITTIFVIKVYTFALKIRRGSASSRKLRSRHTYNTNISFLRRRFSSVLFQR